ncbi:hypothetical protein HMPREF3186_01300 [Gemella haemolysans]|uniref:Methyltransferase n=1 Tax=Gemella haemolysans TaxID=1379 RepID=A0A133ZUG9_9BACL|nr:hypothetical protein HMPREF3186_01300 [Gemella haemolysans]
MAGALLEGEMAEIIEKAGFMKFQIINSDVTDEYAEKWGYGKEMKDYIQSGLLIGRK